MLTLITDRNALQHERGVPSPVKLETWVKFRKPKTLQLFLNPDRPWITLEAAQKLVSDPKTKAWFAQVKNVKGFVITSKDGKESTGLLPVNGSLKAMVERLTNGYLRVRLISGARDEWENFNLPERFEVLPSIYRANR